VNRLRIGTRGSPLALWQARRVSEQIAKHNGPPTELVIIKTTGDRLSQTPVSEAGGKRLFVKEIEDALIENRIDIAVHSAKDLPAARLPGLAISAALPREDPRDAVVVRQNAHERSTKEHVTPDDLFEKTKYGQRIGTGSVRRIAQLRHAFPELKIEPVRGNVGTRLQKLDDGNFDLLILAAAGLVRLDLADRIALRIPSTLCLPAPGQGIVVAEYRLKNSDIRNLFHKMSEQTTSAALAAERAVVTALGADCRVPLGALATSSNGKLSLRGIVASPDGKQLIRKELHGDINSASDLGVMVASALLADGAGDLLGPDSPSSG
jgi:hydroxymethylbilane synthase